jgi:hypothetical protein
MKYIAPFILLCITGMSCFGQSAEDSVKAAVNQLFTAMKAGDSALLVSCFTGNAMLQTITKNNGGAMATTDSVSQFASAISKAPKGSLDERILFDMIKIDGPLASVWTPYSFYYNGLFIHCGVNSFQLLRTGQGWKIQYIIDTRRKEGCAK